MPSGAVRGTRCGLGQAVRATLSVLPNSYFRRCVSFDRIFSWSDKVDSVSCRMCNCIFDLSWNLGILNLFLQIDNWDGKKLFDYVYESSEVISV
jgi:hypothetical protein